MAKFITDSAKLTALIGTIKTAGAKLDKDIQAALVGATYQAIEHGNTNPVNALFVGLNKGTRRTAVAGWLSTYCPVQLTEGDAKSESPFTLDKDRRAELQPTAEAHCDAALGDIWTDFKPEPDVLGAFDVRKQLEALLAQIAKASKAGRTVEGAELVTALTALVTTPDEEIATL